MRKVPAIAPTPTSLPPRQVILISALFGLLLLTQLRFPPISYPHIGLLLLVIAVALGTVLPYLVFKQARINGWPAIQHPALLPGAGFIIWTHIRWAMEDFQYSGAAQVGTVLWTGVYLVSAASLAWLVKHSILLKSNAPALSTAFLLLLSAVGLLCGLHATWQYHFAYAEAYRELKAAIGLRPPDRTELGLLHHLQLRRVASIWGDPNALATFSAIATCASLEVLTFWKSNRWRAIPSLAALSIAACMASIFYSGSRGGVLDIAGVFAVYGAFFLYKTYTGRRAGKAASGAAIIITALALTASRPVPAQDAPPAVELEKAAEKGWVWRSNTIRERLYYLQVGTGMVKLAPVIGLGPGSVEWYFGRLKPPEAREARHLHNWVAQVWAELGLVGIALLGWFLTAIAWRSISHGLWQARVLRALLLIYILIIADGLIQISWNQRELMAIFGIVCGLLISHTPSARPAAPRWNNAPWLTGTILLAIALAIFETRHLAARSNKQIAIDAAYAGDPATADKYYQRASRWAPQDPEPIVARTHLALERGNLSASRSLVEKALQAEPDSAATHALAASIYQQLRQPDKADTHLTEAIRLYPSHAGYNYLYAQLLLSQGKLSSALEHAQKAESVNYLAEEQDKYSVLVQEILAAQKGKNPHE